MPLLVERAQIAAQLEVTKGTAVPPTVTEAGIEVYDPSWTPNIEIAERDSKRASFDTFENIVGNRSATLTFRVALKGSGTAGTAAEMSILLQGCGLTETIVPVTSVAYDPESDNATNQTLTIDYLNDGKLYRLAGAMGNAKFIFAENEVPFVEFTFVGIYTTPTDSALLAPTYGTTSPPNPVGMTLSWNSEVLCAVNCEIDLGNDVQLRRSVTEASGIKHAVIVNRQTQITADPEEELEATVGWATDMVAATAGAFSLVIGATAGNIHTFALPNVQITGVTMAERDGIVVANLTLMARANTDAGDDSLSYTQT